MRIDHGSLTNPIWEQLRDHHADIFQGVTAYSGDQFNISPGGQAELVQGLWTSGTFFDVVGVPAILGRTYTAEDDRRGGGPNGPVTVISYAFWQRHFGGAADVIGRSITANRVALTIVGVTPPGFLGPDLGRSFDLAVPIGDEPVMRGAESWLDKRSTWWLEIVGRLKPGQTEADAASALTAVQPQVRAATLPERWPPEFLKEYLTGPMSVIPHGSGSSNIRSRYREPLFTLTGDGGARAADRLCQHREPVTGESDRPPARNESAAGAGRVAPAPRPRPARRESSALGCRGRARSAVRTVGVEAPGDTALNRAGHGRARPHARLAGPDVHNWCSDCDGAALRSRARVESGQRGAGRSAYRSRPRRVQRHAPPAGQSAYRGAGRVVGDAAGRRWIVRADLRVARVAGPRVRSRSVAARHARRTAKWRCRGRSARALHACAGCGRNAPRCGTRCRFGPDTAERHELERCRRSRRTAATQGSRPYGLVQRRHARLVCDLRHEGSRRPRLRFARPYGVNASRGRERSLRAQVRAGHRSRWQVDPPAGPRRGTANEGARDHRRRGQQCLQRSTQGHRARRLYVLRAEQRRERAVLSPYGPGGQRAIARAAWCAAW